MLTILRGLPGAGKSTIAHQLATAVGGEVIEADQYFMQDGQYQFDPRVLPAAHEDCLRRTAAALAAGRAVFVANTFTRRWEYAPYLTLAQELNKPVQVLEVHGQFPNIHACPESAIAAMRARWEPYISNGDQQ
jgi:predicted kinase